MLKSLNCQFAVITPDGEKSGTLEVIIPKARKKREASGINFKPMYIDQVSKIQPGEEIHIFTPPPGIPVEKYRGALCGHCSTNWGRDSYSTQVKDGVVQLMRWQ